VGGWGVRRRAAASEEVGLTRRAKVETEGSMRGGWQVVEGDEVSNVINKLDKITLNLYTAPRAYGWLEPGAASGGRSTRGRQIRKQSNSREEE
jgi:hypothetical protein